MQDMLLKPEAPSIAEQSSSSDSRFLRFSAELEGARCKVQGVRCEVSTLKQHLLQPLL
jgi:hypothetical protein